jgi:hypothetical protein
MVIRNVVFLGNLWDHIKLYDLQDGQMIGHSKRLQLSQGLFRRHLAASRTRQRRHGSESLVPLWGFRFLKQDLAGRATCILP